MTCAGLERVQSNDSSYAEVKEGFHSYFPDLPMTC